MPGIDATHRHHAPNTQAAAPVLQVKGLTARYGDQTILDNVSLDVQPGEILFIAGGSGSGKSTLMKHMIGLRQPDAGEVFIAGERFTGAEGNARKRLLRRIGVMYQGGALFGSLTILENVRLPLEEFTELPPAAQNLTALSKLKLVGLEQAAHRLPAALSGGMQKRAAIARAIALDPQIVFLDEPSAGLDPITSAELDALVRTLANLLGTTFVIVSHELPSIFAIGDRVVMLDAQSHRMVAVGTPANLRDHSDIPWVRAFFARRSVDDPSNEPPAATTPTGKAYGQAAAGD